MDLDAEEASRALALARALAGGWQYPVEYCPRRPDRQARCERADAGRERAGLQRAWRTRSEAHHLPIAKPRSVGPALQSVAAAHRARVDRAHDERPHPDLELVVVLHAAQVALWAELGLSVAVGAQGIRVRQHARELTVCTSIVDCALQRRDRAAARPALHRAHDERRVLELAGAVSGYRLVQQQHAEIGGDRVKAAAVHDPRAAVRRDGVESVDRVAHEQNLAGQIRVVRACPCARLEQRQPVAAVRTDRRPHHTCGAGELPQRPLVGGVGCQQRPAGGAAAERSLQVA